ncbi:MAG: exo-alpha-sialidase, partial [Clostridia bacterium]|nr:exo-alpha-sialidase [Clostridia bacterium]
VTARFKNILYGSGKRRGRILIGVCLVLCVLAGGIVACQTEDDLTDDIDYAEGIYIKDIAGADMVLIDGTSPCTFWGADGVVIEGLTDGDRIRIGVREFLDSSPMQAEVYSIEKLSDGTIDDIDPAVLDSLRELGWINADNSVVNYGHGPFIGYVNDKESPWIDLYTELNGTYVGRIPYEIFNGWPATDRNSEGWTPGWEPEYLKYYYAEFDDFRWAAVHLEGTVLGSGRVNVATSSDGGKTWTCGNYTDDYGGNHVTGIGFESAKIAVMCFDSMYEHDLFAEEGMTLPVVLSRTEDGGKTWKRMEIAVPDGWGNYQTRPSVPVFDSPSGRIPVTRYDKTTGTEVDTVYLVTSIAGLTWEWEDIVPENNFNPDTFFGASNPNMRADLLFWHRMFPAADNTYLYFCAIRNLNSTMTSYTDDPPKEFMIYWTKNGENFMAAEAKLPDDLQYDSVCPVVVTDNGGGSGETEFIVQLTHGEKIFYASFDNFTWGDAHDAFTFIYRGILSDDEVNKLKAQYPDAFRKAEKFYWNFTLADFKNANPGNSFVYEGYTVEYECASPYGGTFDFHIHLPQLNSNALYAEKWNYIYQEYEVEFGDLLRKTVHGTNTDHYLNITYNTVTTGDVLTIYIIKSHGILASGAYTRDYDIYHYNRKTDRFLSTDEFLAYYAEGQFADYTVADIVKFMNDLRITTDEAGNPYPLTEENICGVIPSVFGDGKFDVVYHGYTMEGNHATRMLFSPYPTYGSTNPNTGLGTEYTYRFTYHDYVDCEDKEMYGTPAGYRLLINQRVVGEYDAGYYVDCLFTEDIQEPPESYPLGEYGGYYTPVNQDAYGNMYVVVDHETDWGHLNAWIPFDMPATAQDYYRGVCYKYFSYDRILNGTNDEVNQNIAAQVAKVLDAYRKGKDPNELFPASATDYTPYPLDTIRENPTHEEIGEILKNTSVGESGIINFDIDLGDGWTMALPIDIGIFGESVQAYFTGVYFAHGTPLEDDAEQNGQASSEKRLSTYSLIPSGTAGRIVSLTLPSAWQWDGSHFNEANVRIGVYPDQKRVSLYGALPTLQEFEATLRESTSRVYQMDSPITGKTDTGYSFTGYYGDEEMPKGEMSRRYLFYITADQGVYTLEIWQRLDFDGANFLAETVLPIVQSFAIQQTLPHQAILEDRSALYDTLSKKEMLISDWLKNNEYTVSQYTVIDLDHDADLETVLWLTHGSDAYAGFLILHSNAGKTNAHLLYYRQFANLKEDGTFDFSGGVSNGGIGEIRFDGEACSISRIAYCESEDNTTVFYYSERDSRSLTKAEYESFEKAQNNKADPVWYAWNANEEHSAQPIDFSSIGGDWYHSFNYENWYAFYGLNFHSNTAEMQFDYGLYESEYTNRYSGTYTVDSATQKITAVMHDDSELHQNADITLQFTLAVRTDGDDVTLVMHIISCDVEKYRHLVGQDLEFTREFGYAALEYQAAQNYYQMWYDKELTLDVLLDKSAVKKDIAKEVREATGMDLLVPSLTWEYTADEDRFPLRFFITDNGGKKMVETNIIRYKDEKDGMEKYAVEVNPTVISVE